MVFGLVVLNRVYNLTCLCPKQGMYYEPRDFNPDFKESLSFLSLRPGACDKLKERVIERRTSYAFLILICILSTVKRLLTVINQHHIILDKNGIVVGI